MNKDISQRDNWSDGDGYRFQITPYTLCLQGYTESDSGKIRALLDRLGFRYNAILYTDTPSLLPVFYIPSSIENQQATLYAVSRILSGILSGSPEEDIDRLLDDALDIELVISL